MRAKALELRAAIAPEDAESASKRIADLFFDNDIFDKDIIAGFESAAGYMPVRNEISPLPLLDALHRRGVSCALPVVRAKDRPLIFRHYAPGDELEIGAYGIGHPSADKKEMSPQFILVPLLAFDVKGVRLGYGAGHYDRTLSSYKRLKKPVIAVGLAFEEQFMDILPRAPHDVALPYILTQKGWRKTSI